MSEALAVLQIITEVLNVAPGLITEIEALVEAVKGFVKAVPPSSPAHAAARAAFVASVKA